MRRLVALVALVGCGYTPPDTATNSNDGVDANDPEPPAVAPALFGCDATSLYRIDFTAQEAIVIGEIKHPGGSAIYIEGLAFHGDRLWALPNNVDERLYELDPTTALIIAETDLPDDRNYWGLTWVPTPAPGRLVAATDTGELYAITPTGATLIGTFGSGLGIAGDLTWDAQRGLVATVRGSSCSGGCIASIDSGTAAATILSEDQPADLWATGAFANGLFALAGNGNVYSIDRTSGVVSLEFNTSVSYSDAAP